MKEANKFQSTLPHGERHISYPYPIKVWEFQSTLPHGERLIMRKVWPAEGRFQSTLPHGERHGGFGEAGYHNEVSIHAPTWGATVQRHRTL